MKLIKYVNAYMALTELMEKEYDYSTAYAILRLRRRLAPQAEFYRDSEMKLVNEYAKKDSDGNIVWSDKTRFVFAENKSAEEYIRKRAELADTDIDDAVKCEKIKLVGGIRPSVVEALEGFVEVVEDD